MATNARVAAIATPKKGSVTQSSNTTATTNPTTTDTVDASATYTGSDLTAFSFKRTRTDGAAISLNLDNLGEEQIIIPSDIARLSDERAGRLIKQEGNSLRATDAFVARLGTGTDYLTAGYWLYAPNTTATAT